MCAGALEANAGLLIFAVPAATALSSFSNSLERRFVSAATSINPVVSSERVPSGVTADASTLSDFSLFAVELDPRLAQRFSLRWSSA